MTEIDREVGRGRAKATRSGVDGPASSLHLEDDGLTKGVAALAHLSPDVEVSP